MQLLQVILSILLCLILTQCRSTEKPAILETALPYQRLDYQQNMMGTRFIITVYAKDKQAADQAAAEAFQLADSVNDACSDYDVTSELMHLNATPANQPIPASPLLFDVLSQALKIAGQTSGAYDPTLGNHSYNWRMARKKGTLPSIEKINLAKKSSGWKNIQLDSKNSTVTKKVENMRLDLGGIAKGYAAELMFQHFLKLGLPHTSITAGGDVRLGNPPPGKEGWKVNLKTLDAHHQLSPQTITLFNCAISTSGDLHQSITINGQSYSHICDPDTGLGLTHRISATVIAKNSTQADALATALCVERELDLSDIQYLIIDEDSTGLLRSKPSKLRPTNNFQ